MPEDEEPVTASEIEMKGERPVNISETHLQELSLLMKETGFEVMEEYHVQFGEILENLGLFSGFAGTGPVPLEVWTGIAQALADVSGYSVILAAEILEPIKDSLGMSRSVGKREIAKLEPTLFVKPG